ncbi:MAG TPA: response regulator [Acidobacteriota bacterium]|nr:response regulator [Acidobacteriota bacterium]
MPNRQKLIVVVDDNELFCGKMAQFFKERYGDKVKVETYTDPLKGLRCLVPELDLLIVDLEMPMIDGKKFLQFARQKGVDHKRIIIASFQSAEILHQKFQLSECLAVMDKNEPEQQKVFAMITDSIMRKP